MTIRLLPLATCLLLVSVGCKGDDSVAAAPSAKAGAAAAPAAAPADAKTIAAFRGEYPKAGGRAKLHGFVGSTNGDAWPVVDKVGDTLPFVFCKMASPPTGVAKGAHVVIEGKVEDDAMLVDCTLKPL